MRLKAHSAHKSRRERRKVVSKFTGAREALLFSDGKVQKTDLVMTLGTPPPVRPKAPLGPQGEEDMGFED